MVESTEPRKMLIERCTLFIQAERVALIASGVATSMAMMTPPSGAGAFSVSIR
jgi:hypothetical protein